MLYYVHSLVHALSPRTHTLTTLSFSRVQRLLNGRKPLSPSTPFRPLQKQTQTHTRTHTRTHQHIHKQCARTTQRASSKLPPAHKQPTRFAKSARTHIHTPHPHTDSLTQHAYPPTHAHTHTYTHIVSHTHKTCTSTNSVQGLRNGRVPSLGLHIHHRHGLPKVHLLMPRWPVHGLALHCDCGCRLCTYVEETPTLCDGCVCACSTQKKCGCG